MDAPVWDAVWGYVVPLAIPLLLLQCDMRKIGKDAGRILIIFVIGSFGTAFGTLGYVLGTYFGLIVGGILGA